MGIEGVTYRELAEWVGNDRRGYTAYSGMPRIAGMTSNEHPQVNNANHRTALYQFRRYQVRNDRRGRVCGRTGKPSGLENVRISDLLFDDAELGRDSIPAVFHHQIPVFASPPEVPRSRRQRFIR
jgi:hypothetical protein